MSSDDIDTNSMSNQGDDNRALTRGHVYGDISAGGSSHVQLGDQYIGQQFVTVNLGSSKQTLKRKRSDDSINDTISETFAFRGLHDRFELIEYPQHGTFSWTTQGLTEDQEFEYWRIKTMQDPLGLLEWLKTGTGIL